MLRSILLFGACAMLLAPACVAQQLGPSDPDLSQPIAEVGPGLGLYLVRKEYVVGAFGCTYVHYIFSDGTELVELSDCGDAIGLLINALISAD
ncbi:MAG TPA: hypothetical protein VIY49_31055 [Bryobacteraceae bacterium]